MRLFQVFPLFFKEFAGLKRNSLPDVSYMDSALYVVL